MGKPLTPEKRRRRNELILIAIISVLIVIFTTVEMRYPRVLGVLPAANNLVVFSLININIILILLLIFLVIRNLVKLIFERKRGVLGAKLRTRLVVAFVSLSLIPTVLLFLVAVGFITNSVEHWFSSQVEQSLQGAIDVAQQYYQDFTDSAVSSAQRVAGLIAQRGDIRTERNRGPLRAELEAKRQEYGLEGLRVYVKREPETFGVEDLVLKEVPYRIPKELLRAGLSGKEASRVFSVGEGELIMGVAPVFFPPDTRKVVAVVAASHFIPESLSVKMRDISKAYVEYKQLKMLKQPIKSSYKMALLMVTLLILFSATWFGFHLAKDITVPIKELAEATHRIAMGDLSTRIEMKAADEVGMLVESFNQMTGDLQVFRSQLEQRKKYMEIVLKNVAAGVISIDEQGVITTINTSAERMLDLQADAVLGKPFGEVLHPKYVRQIEEILRELKGSGDESIEKQLTVYLKGKTLSLLINLTNLWDDEGKPLGIVAVFDDLTQLVKAQRMAAWREVARRIAHEIKNPLTPIQLSAQRLRKRYLDRLSGDGVVFDECTRTIIKQVDELKAMVNEFSNFARMPASNPSPERLNEIIEEALILFREARKDVRFDFQPREVPVFNLDRDQMKRVMINLLKNSLAAMEGEGEIRVRTDYDPRLQIAKIEVSDTGCGIPDEDKARLFEPYFSTRKTGTGLGLTIVNAIVSDHNGYIRVRDNAPRGTTFLIELPVRV